MAWTTPSIKTTGTLITAAIWNEQITNNAIWLGTAHDHSGDAGDGGTVSGATPVSGMVGIFDTSCPSNWTRVTAFDNRLLYGASSYGATGGSDTHSHSESGHSHTGTHTHSVGTLGLSAGDTYIQIGAGGTTISSGSHTHTISGTSGTPTISAGTITINSGNTLPPYISVVFCERN